MTSQLRDPKFQILDAFPSPIWHLGPDGSCDFVNAAWLSFSGLTYEQSLGVGWTQTVMAEDMIRGQKLFDDALANKAPFEVEWRQRAADGSWRWTISCGKPEFDERGQISGYIGYLYDITDRKRAELALAESEARFRTLFEHLPVPTLAQDYSSIQDYIETLITQYGIQDLDAFLKEHPEELHKCVSLVRDVGCNQAALKVFGVQSLEEIGARRIEFFSDESLALFRGALVGFQNGNLSGTEEFTICLPDEQVRHVVLRASMILSERGRWDRVLLSFFDITEQKQAQERLLRTEEQLRQAQKLESVGRLAGGVAHDFNNILSAILGYADLALSELQPIDPLYETVEQIQQAGQRASRLTRQLLAFSRKQVLETQVLDLNQTVHEIDRMLRRVIGEDIALDLRLDPRLGPVRADVSQLEQILMNLVVNARDAMPQGGRLTIETSNITLDSEYSSSHIDCPPGAYVMLAVSDTGVGMDAATRAHIFEPFFTTKERGKGTGLGLSMVYGIVRQHGGHVFCYSEPNRGTTFKVYLPQVDAQPDPRVTLASVFPRPGGQETVLVVEDEEMVRQLTCRLLRAQGYRIIESRDAEDALRLALNPDLKIDLLLTDVIMPGLSGPALYEQISALRPQLRVLFMSGYTDSMVVHHKLLDSGLHFMQKPFSRHSLLKKVRETLDLPQEVCKALFP